MAASLGWWTVISVLSAAVAGAVAGGVAAVVVRTRGDRRERDRVVPEFSPWQPPGTIWERPAKKPARAYVNRVLWSYGWRSMLMGVVFLAAFGFAVGPPLLAVVGFVVTGLALGLWHRHRGGLGPLWRNLALTATTAYLGPSFPGLFPLALSSLVGVNVVAPWLSARRAHAV